jgi:DNA-directed RNA polymerase subunit K/omega
MRNNENEGDVIQRPTEINAFEFVILSGLRAAQLMRGCTPRVASTHKVITTAQMEVAERKIVRAPNAIVVPIV